jgi:acetyltransferase
MLEQTKIYSALQGFRSKKSVNLSELEFLMVRFSQLVVELRESIAEIEVNPLLASGDGLWVLDARIVLSTTNQALMAIRPYPNQYIETQQLKDGTEILLRPVRPEDEPLVAHFYQNVSEISFYRRYFHLMKLQSIISHERLSRNCFIDYDREISILALSAQEEVLAIGHLTKSEQDNREGRFGLLVADRQQGRGIGQKLLIHLLTIAQKEGMTRIGGEILRENLPMQSLCRKLGFSVARDSDPVLVNYELSMQNIQ